MPLYVTLRTTLGLANNSRHLLAKKSWNVYNKDNIERVRCDEAEARVKALDAESRAKSDDAAEQLRLLRGGSPLVEGRIHESRSDHKRKRDDGDNEDEHVRSHQVERRSKHARRDEDDGGASTRYTSRGTKDANVTSESLDKISNMLFRDAAGRHAAAQKPWYSTTTSGDREEREMGKDVWGNVDAGRHIRDQQRIDASDPLLAMKRGVKQLKEVEKQKTEWRKEREKDLYEVEDLARKERHRQRKEQRNRHGEEGKSERHRFHKRDIHDRHPHQQKRERDRSEHRSRRVERI